ncbi:hypothetical protein BV392_04365 [Rhodovulum sulfidophilum]|nr:hypothetical protein BV392_04365 [Rhodovulum sulfidophilum]
MTYQMRMKHPHKLSRLSAIKRDQRETFSRIPLRRCNLQESSRFSDALVGRPTKEASDFRIGGITVEDGLRVIQIHSAKMIAVGLELIGKAVGCGHPATLTIAPSVASC